MNTRAKENPALTATGADSGYALIAESSLNPTRNVPGCAAAGAAGTSTHRPAAMLRSVRRTTPRLVKHGGKT